MPELEHPVPLSSATDLSTETHVEDVTQEGDFATIYEIDETCCKIEDCDFHCIALQFPDELLKDAVPVYQALRRRLSAERELYILADTTYGSCCVDEIACEHVNADVVIHYGHSCLSPTQRLPVIYVFLKQPVSIDAVISNLRLFQEANPTFFRDLTTARLKYDVAYEWRIEEITNRIRSVLSIPIYCDRSLSISRLNKGKDRASEHKDRSDPATTSDDGSKTADIFLYLGKPSLSLTHLLMTQPQIPILAYDPSSLTAHFELASNRGNKLLMRRYAAIQKARDADVFGIVVGTLGVASYLPLVNRLRTMLRRHQKKVYTLCVGKPTPSKLANYQEIECFVLVACPENSLLLTSQDEGKQYLRPIITPWEAEVALGGKKTWEDGWRLGWDAADEEVDEVAEQEEVQFSSVTGQLRTVRRFASGKKADGLADALGSLSLQVRSDSSRQVARLMGSAAGEHINGLSYRGLDPRIGEDGPALMEQGRSGTASRYQEETS